MSRVASTLYATAYSVLHAMGMRGPEDGWRMSARIHLRSEVARFALTALGLQLEETATVEAATRRFVHRFGGFLRGWPLAGRALEWHALYAVAVPKDNIDVTLAHFDPAGQLLSIDPLLDDRHPVEYDRFLRAMLTELICEAYNDTRFEPDLTRPLALRHHAHSRIGAAVGRASLPADARAAAAEFVWRVLTSTVVSVESMPSSSRFIPPQFLDARHFGHGVFNVRLRLIDGPPYNLGDLWVQVNHAALDGSPVQDMLSGLKREWGAVTVPFPTDSGGSASAVLPATLETEVLAARAAWTYPVRCSPDGDPPHLYSSIEFVDMGAFVALRKEMCERLGEPISPTAMLIWALSHEAPFVGRTFSAAVDVPPAGPAPRAVTLAVARPHRHYPGAYEGAGFVAFARAFSRQVERGKRRESGVWRMLEKTGALPLRAVAWTARNQPELAQDTLGTVGVSLIKEAEIFVAPAHGVFADGFIGFGDFQHPAESDQTRCAVSFKGSRRRVELARTAVLAIAADPRRYFPSDAAST